MFGSVTLASFYDAGVITGKDRDGPAPCHYQTIMVAAASKRLMQDEQATRLGVTVTADSKMFGRMLAKIALGLTVRLYNSECVAS